MEVILVAREMLSKYGAAAAAYSDTKMRAHQLAGRTEEAKYWGSVARVVRVLRAHQ